MTNIVAGNIAPGFALQSLDGKEYSLGRHLQRGPVVLAFFKVSCPVCQLTFPYLERIYRRYGDDGVAILGVSQDNAEATQKFCREFGITLPVLLEESGYPVSNAYGLTTVPTIFLIGADGTVQISSMGFDKTDLETMAATFAERRKVAPSALFRPDEQVPAHKPG